MQSFLYVNRGGELSSELCIVELQQLMEVEQITDDTKLFTEKFDDWMPAAAAMEFHKGLSEALETNYAGVVRWLDAAADETSDEIASLELLELIRAGKVDDGTQVWAPEHMQGWGSLGSVRPLFWFAEFIATVRALPGRLSALAFPTINQACMASLYACAGRLTAQNAVSGPGRPEVGSRSSRMLPSTRRSLGGRWSSPGCRTPARRRRTRRA